jgi:hypothetical protein
VPSNDVQRLATRASYDIVVKQHAGSFEVDTQPGEFTEIRIILPRRTAHLSVEQAQRLLLSELCCSTVGLIVVLNVIHGAANSVGAIGSMADKLHRRA